MPRALISVSNKDGIESIARTLSQAGLELLSTGGTLRAIREAGIPVTPVDEVTRFPELFDGRVKTLHPAIHGGLLYQRDNVEHVAQANEHGIEPIDVLVCNLYPFEETISRSGVTDNDAIENIDIGGPAMIRAAAKNHQHVAVIVDPADYDRISTLISDQGLDGLDASTRRELAARAFSHTASYDAMVSGYLNEDAAPSELAISGRKVDTLRYGENPHQSAAVYRLHGPESLAGIGGWNVVTESAISYNNYLDATAAWQTVMEFDQPASVIVKHNVPCGVAFDMNIVSAFEQALAGDPVSAFGGVIAVNRAVDDQLAAVIAQRKYDVLLAPGFSSEATDRLKKRKGLKLIDTSNAVSVPEQEVRMIPGGMLVQTADRAPVDTASWTVATERAPSEQEVEQLAFAWTVVKHVKSNAIVLVQDNGTVGICGGQPNRVDSVRMAIERAGSRAKGAVLASDAFFPFADGVEEAVNAGVTAIAQPGGSMRDPETIAAANEAGAAMVMTGIRHFRH
jgi:phosphoribosylaminoimidazolecarboxamide formyltransferase / IMP cyclohydrolase